MATIQDIKARVKIKLDTLVPTSLAEVVTQDLKEDPLNRDYPAFPVCVITPPALETSEVLDNRSNVRTYVFRLVVMMKPENFATVYEVENLQETIVNIFDNDPTLTGDGDAGVDPSYTPAYPLNYAGRDLVYFEVYLKIKVRKDLSFT